MSNLKLDEEMVTSSLDDSSSSKDVSSVSSIESSDFEYKDPICEEKKKNSGKGGFFVTRRFLLMVFFVIFFCALAVLSIFVLYRQFSAPPSRSSYENKNGVYSTSTIENGAYSKPKIGGKEKELKCEGSCYCYKKEERRVAVAPVPAVGVVLFIINTFFFGEVLNIAKEIGQEKCEVEFGQSCEEDEEIVFEGDDCAFHSLDYFRFCKTQCLADPSSIIGNKDLSDLKKLQEICNGKDFEFVRFYEGFSSLENLGDVRSHFDVVSDILNGYEFDGFCRIQSQRFGVNQCIGHTKYDLVYCETHTK